MTKCDFFVTLEVAVTFFAYTLQLNVSLQSKQQDLSQALSNVMMIRSALQELRGNENEYFKQIFMVVSDLANLVNVEICMSRICGKQTYKVNVNPKDL